MVTSMQNIASSSLRIYGGTVQISELVIDNTFSDSTSIKLIFDRLILWAKGQAIHKIWLIDNLLLNRTKMYEDNGFVIEAHLKNNIYHQDEIIYYKLMNAEKTRRCDFESTKFNIDIIKGRKLVKFRETVQLNQIINQLGKEKGLAYFKGFKKPKQSTLEIKSAGKLIGSAALQIYGRVLMIEAFILKRDYRGMGIGTSALSTIENYAKKSGCHKMQLITNPKLRVVNLYARHGWKKEATLKNNIVNLDEIIMYKFL